MQSSISRPLRASTEPQPGGGVRRFPAPRLELTGYARRRVRLVTEGQRPLQLIHARNLMTGLSTPAFLVDADGIVVFYNDAAGALLGRRFEEGASWLRSAGARSSVRWTTRTGRSPGRSCRSRSLCAATALRSGAFDRALDGREHEIHVTAIPIVTMSGTTGRWRSSGHSTTRRPDLQVTIWGARGSVPSPGWETSRYGGNTSCVSVTLSDGTLVVLDAGTGIRSLGLALTPETDRIYILLTHLHLDHIQGLMFSRRCSPGRAHRDLGTRSARRNASGPHRPLTSAPLSPVEVRELPATSRSARPTRVGGGLGHRAGRFGHAPRAHARLPHHRRRHVALLHPRPRARAGHRPRGSRSGVDQRLRPRQGFHGCSCTTASTRTQEYPPTWAGGTRASPTR